MAQAKKELAAQVSALAESKKAEANALVALQKGEAELSSRSRIRKADDQIQQLIEEFSKTGVDLHNVPNCDDAAAVIQYQNARAKRDAIAAIASQTGGKEEVPLFSIPHKFSNCIPE